jgi:MerR family transcriptional regulator, light-induced transcriptional regulator
MATYTIAQLSELSGIKAHTIRIWEKRYQLLEPERTHSNIRRYDDNQLRRLLNTVMLLNNGYKISRIASYTEDDINKLIEKKIDDQKSTDFAAEAIINQLISSGLTYNEIDFEKGFSSAVLRFGVKATYTKIIYPVLVRAGYMWSNTSLSPCQEHFISNLIKRKLFTALDSIPVNQGSKRKWLLFLPENEYHEIGLLFACYLIRAAGHSVVYLGQSVPYENLKATVAEYRPTDILFFTVHRLPKNTLQRMLKNMEADFKSTSIVISANSDELKYVKSGKNVHRVSSVEELSVLL